MVFDVNALLRGFKHDRRNSRRFSAVAAAEIQQLESRVVPAAVNGGVVSASLSGSTLIITGDTKANHLDVVAYDEGIEIYGFDGTKVKFGGVTATNAFISLANLGGDFDFSSLVVNLSSGDDQLAVFVDGVDVTLSANALIDLGSGNDAFSLFTDFGGSVAVDNLFQILGGSGNNTIGLSSLSQDDLVARFGGGFDNAATDANISAGYLTIVTSTGNDSVALVGVDVAHNTVISLSNGTNHLGVDSVGVGGVLIVTTGTGTDRIGATNLSVEGLAQIITSSGNDVVAVDNASFGSTVQVFTGSGNDLVVIGSGVEAANPNRVYLTDTVGTNRLLDDTDGLADAGAHVTKFLAFNAAAETAANNAGVALLNALAGVFKLEI